MNDLLPHDIDVCRVVSDKARNCMIDTLYEKGEEGVPLAYIDLTPCMNPTKPDKELGY